jgi:eukaryotic-like serine/threonine-protein kinase
MAKMGERPGWSLPDPTTMLGRVIGGKLELRDLLGEGTMGWVFRAQHRALNKTVAVKVLKRTGERAAVWSERFAREARSAAKFDHPNSVQILDFGEDGADRLMYIVMEYLAGRNLRELLAGEGPMDPRRLANIMLQVLAALAAAHEQGVIHRDIKPANIMILKKRDDDGELVDVVKVCDFGLAKIMSPTASGEGRLTLTGAFVGTPAYMSPEQAADETLDERTDIYSCGVVMYEMLAGRLPFEEDNQMAMIFKHMSAEPPKLSEFVPTIDRRIEAIVHWAMEKNRDQRCQSAREMRRSLKEFLGLDAEMSIVAKIPLVDTEPMLFTDLDKTLPDIPMHMDTTPHVAATSSDIGTPETARDGYPSIREDD